MRWVTLHKILRCQWATVEPSRLSIYRHSSQPQMGGRLGGHRDTNQPRDTISRSDIASSQRSRRKTHTNSSSRVLISKSCANMATLSMQVRLVQKDQAQTLKKKSQSATRRHPLHGSSYVLSKDIESSQKNRATITSKTHLTKTD